MYPNLAVPLHSKSLNTISTSDSEANLWSGAVSRRAGKVPEKYSEKGNHAQSNEERKHTTRAPQGLVAAARPASNAPSTPAPSRY